ncbi:YciI family protein [Pseudonocardia spirodelae]|uniref:YciI family protein n=1 Tax=Pseudonocardia spirodelae TaxID=3133431 RepID=A0ABU8T6F2_9PSEU
MATFAVTYTYAENSGADRDNHRPAHKDFLAGLHESGRLRVSGPVDGGSGALLVIEGGSAQEIAAVLDADPFRTAGLIGARTIHEWSIVFGGLA